MDNIEVVQTRIPLGYVARLEKYFALKKIPTKSLSDMLIKLADRALAELETMELAEKTINELKA